MKRLFVFTALVMLLSMAVTVPASASVTNKGWDNDVGAMMGLDVTQQKTFAEFSPMLGHSGVYLQVKALQHDELTIFHSNGTKAAAPIFWEGKDSKSSLCKAILNNVKNTNRESLASTYKFGKGNKRLSC